MLNNIKTKQRGFTIVELLIVIVVIAILAAISIVAYNGVQNRGRSSAAASASANMAKKLEAYNSVTGAYPVYNTAANVTTALAAQNESSLTGSGLSIGTPSSSNGTTTVQVRLCTATSTQTAGTTPSIGYVVYRWDYSAATPALQSTPDQVGGTTSGGTTTCTAI